MNEFLKKVKKHTMGRILLELFKSYSFKYFNYANEK